MTRKFVLTAVISIAVIVFPVALVVSGGLSQVKNIFRNIVDWSGAERADDYEGGSSGVPGGAGLHGRTGFDGSREWGHSSDVVASGDDTFDGSTDSDEAEGDGPESPSRPTVSPVNVTRFSGKSGGRPDDGTGDNRQQSPTPSVVSAGSGKQDDDRSGVTGGTRKSVTAIEMHPVPDVGAGSTSCNITCRIPFPTSCRISCDEPEEAKCWCGQDPKRGPGDWDHCECQSEKREAGHVGDYPNSCSATCGDVGKTTCNITCPGSKKPKCSCEYLGPPDRPNVGLWDVCVCE